MTHCFSASDSELDLEAINYLRKTQPRAKLTTPQIMPDNLSLSGRKLPLSRAATLGLKIASCVESEINPSRSRSNSLPTATDLEMIQLQQEMEKVFEEHHHRLGERHLFALMINIGHIVVAVAVTQLGIVGAWYLKFMNFEEDMLRCIVYICLLFAISGAYGLLIQLKKLQSYRAHRIAYCTISTLSVVAATFITFCGLRLTILDTYRSDITPIVLFDGFVIGLSIIEIPMAIIGVYLTVPNLCKKTITEKELSTENTQSKVKVLVCESWTSIFGIILNVAHVVLGLCILELGMVGMLYKRFMNVESMGLFVVVLVSIGFISLGALGLLNQVTGSTNAKCNQVMYTCGSLVVVGSATFLLTMISVTLNSEYYYAGFEAVVAFNSMIISISGIELLITIAALLLGLIPYCQKKFWRAGEEREAVPIIRSKKLMRNWINIEERPSEEGYLVRNRSSQ